MAFEYDPIFAVDPSNTDISAQNAQLVIHLPGDTSLTAVTLTTLTGMSYENPVMTNERAFAPAFISADQPELVASTLDGAFSVTLHSVRGIRDAAAASANASELSASAARDAANLVDAPAGNAVDTSIQPGGAARATLDTAIGSGAVDVARVSGGTVSVVDHGAVADYNGTTGTDNSAAFNAALSASSEGGTVMVPPGRYYFTAPININKTVDLTTGAGGYRDSSIGTELTFAPGVSGVRIEQGAASVRPSKWRLGPFNIRSKSTAAGTDVGIFVSAGRGTIDGATVDGFGSHGIHLLAGVGYGDGAGNANNTVLQTCRAYGNRGDGIRAEGTDSNAILMVKPDVVANYGWGINLERAAICVIAAAHADQQYNGSPGAFRDNGNSNKWDWIYSEGSKPLLIDTNSSYGQVNMSLYAAPAIQYNGSGYQSWRINGSQGSARIRMKGVTPLDTKQWEFSTSKVAGDSWDLVQVTDNLKVLSVNGAVTATTHYTTQQPDVALTRDLGSSSRAWRDVYTGAVRFTDNGALPAASSSLRGQTRMVHAASGTADSVHVCIRNADGAYVWQQIA